MINILVFIFYINWIEMRVGNWCNEQNASKAEFYVENPQERIIPVQK